MIVILENQERGSTEAKGEMSFQKKDVYHAKCYGEVMEQSPPGFCTVEGIGDLSKQP